MISTPTRQFRRQYEGLLMDIMERGSEETNARTGAVVRALGPRTVTVGLADGTLPLCGVRRTYPATAAAEVAWFLSGDQDSAFIRGYAPIWDKFVEDDGTTVLRAYGYRWRRHFGRDQIADAVRALSEDPTDRRVWVSAWDPAEDGLGRKGQRNVPCPVGFTLSVVGGRLNSMLVMRSSDVFVGLPYDVMGHALLMDAVLASLRGRGASGLALGEAAFSLAHPHLYGAHFAMVKGALGGEPSDDSAALPGWSVSEIAEDPHGYVRSVKEAFGPRRVAPPSFSCRPEVVA